MADERLKAGIDDLLAQYQTDATYDVFMRRSLIELYRSGQYGSAVTEGTRDPNAKRFFRTLRTVGLVGDRLDSAVVLTQPQSGEQDMLKMKQVLVGFSIDLEIFLPLESEALNVLRAQQLQTVAGLSISTSQQTGADIVEIFYPKPLMGLPILGFAVNEEYGRTWAMTLAVYFLKKVPFARNLPIN